MANLDCQAAFSQEMAKLDEISQTVKGILDKFSSSSNSSSAPVGLEAKIDETNRLLKVLCVGILGKDKE